MKNDLLTDLLNLFTNPNYYITLSHFFRTLDPLNNILAVIKFQAQGIYKRYLLKFQN